MNIKNRLRDVYIQRLAIDLFGFCNAKCWYCPVRYIPQPEEGQKQMPIEDVEKIFRKILTERNKEFGVVHPEFNLFLTTHYSEILLYKDFEKLLQLARRYKLKTYILSNGVNLTPEKVDLINEYVPDVIEEIGLNIPIFENADLWSKRSGFPAKRFDDLQKNLEYLHDHIVTRKLKDRAIIIINGVNNNSFKFNLSKGNKFDELGIDLDVLNGERARQAEIVKKKFPNFTICESDLIDRTGLISDYITEEPYMKKHSKGKKVIGCQNWGDRVYEWLTLNSKGDAFLCCNDYYFEYKFGNILEQDLEEMWLSDAHIEMIEKAYSNICMKCSAAVMK